MTGSTRRGLLSLAIVAIAACGGGGHSAAPAVATQPTTTVAPTTTTAPTTTVAPTTATTQPVQVVVVTAPPTTIDEAAAQLEADKPLIRGIWYESSKAWFDGPRAGTDFIAAHDYPDMGATPDACFAATFGSKPPPAHYDQSTVVDLSTVAHDDGFVISGGPHVGLHPEGRIYVMDLTTTISGDGFSPRTLKDTVHVTILDGVVYDFLDC
jgi:hypothetical protein